MDDLERLGDQAGVSADRTAEAFEAAAERIGSALSRAAHIGEISFEGMVESVLNNLARLVIEEAVVSPLQNAISGLGNSLANQNGKGPVTVNMNVTGSTDAKGLARSQGQIAAALTRAVAQGRRLT